MQINVSQFWTSFLLAGLTGIVSCSKPPADSDIAKIEKVRNAFKVRAYSPVKEMVPTMDTSWTESGECNYMMGISYLFTNQKGLSLSYFRTAKDSNYKAQDLNFFLARGYHVNHKFDSALAYYKKVKENKGNDFYKKVIEKYELNYQRPPVQYKTMTRFMDECKTGEQLVENSRNVRIKLYGGDTINSPYNDYAPVMSADESVLIFTSRRPDTLEEGEVTDKEYEDIYISTSNKKGEWSKPESIGKNINRTKKNDASIGLSPDGQKLFIYRSNTSSGWGDIYSSEQKGKKWTDPVKLGENVNTNKWEPSASITSDENTLYFTSNREGGHGGLDIYMSRRLPNGKWAKPENMGPRINTKYNEDAPFIHADGKTLYFSSEGHNGMGGYDIFKTTYDEEKDEWSEPENLGFPINKADDDAFFVWSADGKRAYFSSNREGGFGGQDIYMLKKEKSDVSLIVMKGKVMEKGTEEPVGATMTVTNNETDEVVGVYNSNSYSGKYTVIVHPGNNYGIAVEARGYLSYSENVHIPEKKDGEENYHEITKNIFMEPLEPGSMARLKNVFFDLNKATLREESFSELDRFADMLEENPTLYVEIGGHTDSLGAEDYNKELSTKRARSVVDYLIDKGIDKNRLYPIGYGEDYPVATNSTEEGRQKNRRTELIIIDKLEEGDKLKDYKGYYYRLEDPEINTEKEKREERSKE